VKGRGSLNFQRNIAGGIGRTPFPLWVIFTPPDNVDDRVLLLSNIFMGADAGFQLHENISASELEF